MSTYVGSTLVYVNNGATNGLQWGRGKPWPIRGTFELANSQHPTYFVRAVAIDVNNNATNGIQIIAGKIWPIKESPIPETITYPPSFGWSCL